MPHYLIPRRSLSALSPSVPFSGLNHQNPLSSLKEEPTRLLAIVVPLLVFVLLIAVQTSSILSCGPFRHSTLLQHQPSIALSVPSHQRRPVEAQIVSAHPAPLFKKPLPFPAVSLAKHRKLPECAKTASRAQTFLFVFMGHSGSSAILSELQAHSETIIEEREPVDHYHYEFNTTAALAYATEIFQHGIAQGKVPGFKMRPLHIKNNPTGWAHLARQFQTRIIWQYRQNLVKQAVGEYSYKYLNDSSVLEGLRNKEAVNERCNRGVGCSFAITDFEFFHETLKDCVHSDLAIARGVHLLANGSSCIHALPYEDYLYNREGTMRRLQSFLGLKYEETAPQRFKATNDNLCKVVNNWKELCSNFYGCHVWRHMFQDHVNDCYCDFSSGNVKYCDTSYAL